MEQCHVSWVRDDSISGHTIQTGCSSLRGDGDSASKYFATLQG